MIPSERRDTWSGGSTRSSRISRPHRVAERLMESILTAMSGAMFWTSVLAEGRLLIAEGWAVAHHEDGNRLEYIHRTSHLKVAAAHGM
jgi:hypothetical protein